MDTTETTATETKTVTVPTYALSVITERVAKLNTRAAKKGLTCVVGLVTGEPYTVKVSHELDLFDRFENFVEVTITTTQVVLDGGWVLAGLVDFKTAAPGILVHTLDGYEFPDNFREVAVCDHCNRNQRRNKLIVVADAEGNLARVGTTCARDYLGHDPKALLWFAEAVASVGDEDEKGWGGSSDFGWDTISVVAAALVAVRTWGWRPAREDSSTKNDVTRILDRPRNTDSTDLSDARDRVAGFVAEATKIVEWARGLTSGNEYIQNLTAVLEGDYVRPKGLGIAVSVVTAWDREQAREVATKTVEKAVQAYIGSKGDKITVTGTIVNRRWCDGDWGASLLVTINTPQGVVKTFASSGSAFANFIDNVGVGCGVTLAGTVKDHETYQGVMQTVLTRCKAIAVETAVPS